MKHKVYCDEKSLYVDGQYISDCCGNLKSIFEMLAFVLGADYEYVELEE